MGKRVKETVVEEEKKERKDKKERKEKKKDKKDRKEKKEKKRKRSDSESGPSEKKRKKSESEVKPKEEKASSSSSSSANPPYCQPNPPSKEFKKAFYQEHPNVSSMSVQKTASFLEANNIKLHGNNCSYRHIEKLSETGMSEKVMKICSGFEKPTPIQSQCWPVLLCGRDLIAIAETGFFFFLFFFSSLFHSFFSFPFLFFSILFFHSFFSILFSFFFSIPFFSIPFFPFSPLS